MKNRNIIALGIIGFSLFGGGSAAALALTNSRPAPHKAVTAPPTTNNDNQAAPPSTPTPGSPSYPVNGNTVIDPLTGSTATYGYLVSLDVAIDMNILNMPGGSGLFLTDAAKVLSPVDYNGNLIPAAATCPADTDPTLFADAQQIEMYGQEGDLTDAANIAAQALQVADADFPNDSVISHAYSQMTGSTTNNYNSGY
jgi:hypothetical protein